MITLSILICSLNRRKDSLNNLLNILDSSIYNLPIERLILADNGELKIGTKRNKLLDMAKGEYCCFVDDDDMISSTYGKEIIDAINSQIPRPDCIGICGIIKQPDGNWQFRHSITVTNWCKDKKRKLYFRTPNHLNPVKREYCLAAKFPESSFGEDKSYSDKIRSFLKTEIFIENNIYFYTPSGENKK